ncbi:MAG: YihY/virulence factor BrkB family protein, partial [Clostridia bacterium]|nr:YihY/virulence factor BrkB family protein [Clostridia bacterium]
RRSRSIRSEFFSHLPGAVFAAVGWVLFSFFYSLYITYFPNASVIYGGLAAVCLIMLWIYFCTIILLLGAEVNKLFIVWQKRKKKVVSV